MRPLLTFITLLFVASSTISAADGPNVIVLFIDDMGYADPSCFGNPAMNTPNIDRLAIEGIKLTNFYVNSKEAEARSTTIGSTFAVSARQR